MGGTRGRNAGRTMHGATMGILGLLVAVAAVVPGCGRQAKDAGAAWSDRSYVLWVGIPVRVRFSLPAARAQDLPALEAAVLDEIRRTGDAFNAFDAGSEVGRFNRDAGRNPFRPSEELSTLLRVAGAVTKATDGAFDVTVWPLKMLWKRAVKEGVPPAPDDLKAAMTRVGMQRLAFAPDGALLPLEPPATLDFGGIVKGYAVDRAAALLKDRGATAGMVQVGGEIRAFGAAPDGHPWRVGVRDPLDANGLQGVVEASGDLAISTSGNYEQPVRIAGREYYHILDPRTGEPVDTKVLGVTVVQEGGDFPNATADALATAFAVLGPDRGLELAATMPGAGVLFLARDDDGTVRRQASAGMACRYRPAAR